jgi:transcriptional regulator with XRE-family HTH domain
MASAANNHHTNGLTGHALRNAHLRQHSLERARTAPPLARTLVTIRAETLGMTRLEFARRSGISRGTLRDWELGVHTPTRQTLQQFVLFCRQQGVSAPQLEELRGLYAGPGDTLGQLIARLELQAGSPRELARRVGISPATLWEYRRGNFPLPLALLRHLCKAAGEDSARAEILWHQAERQRLSDRGYPEALAEFWVRCARAGYAEKHLLTLGLSTATVRRLRYLELPPWPEVEKVVVLLSHGPEEVQALKRIWIRNENDQQQQRHDGFGARMQQHRKLHGIRRRELADLFGIGGKKPARIIKSIEEDGFYSAQAFPAGLAAVLTRKKADEAQLLDLWRQRRQQFHRRHRPETRTDLRLAREIYGFELKDMEPILGYSSLEYQRIERGVTPLLPTARERILQAIDDAGHRRVDALLRRRTTRELERAAWRSPQSVPALVTLLARREGGLVPLARLLRKSGLKSFWPGRLKAIARGRAIPPWPVVEQLGSTCGVHDLTEVRRDWAQRYRAQLQTHCASPLGVEIRLLIAEVAPTLRSFSPRLGFNYSVLVRDLKRIDRDEPGRWFHVERILIAVGVPVDDDRWREMHALWYTACERRKKTTPFGHRWSTPAPGR